jgi:tetratricopeptide (TPR) repeat protein
MSTKTKISGSANQTPENLLEGQFSEAIELVNQGHHEKAIPALEAVRAGARELGMVALVRAAGNYLTAIQSHFHKPEETPGNPDLVAQLMLNRGAVDEAMELLVEALKNGSQDARLFYLKATAHALKNEAEAAAEEMQKAVSLNQDFLHQFRLERDFDRVRSAAPFVSLGLE